MKKILIPCLLLITTIVQAQLNNSWIDYSKTYYKFRLGTTGLCRINQTTLIRCRIRQCICRSISTMAKRPAGADYILLLPVVLLEAMIISNF